MFLLTLLLLVGLVAAQSSSQHITGRDDVRTEGLDCAADPCAQVLPGAVRFEALEGKPYAAGYDGAGELVGALYHLSVHVHLEALHLGLLRGRGKVAVLVALDALLQRRHVAQHHLLVLVGFDGKDAQLEPAALLPLEERGVLHLVDDLLVDLASLVPLDELALHHAAADLHRETRDHHAVGRGKAEGALAALFGGVVEDVLDLGESQRTVGLHSHVEALELQTLELGAVDT